MRTTSLRLCVASACLGLSVACGSEEAAIEPVRPVISIEVADATTLSRSTFPGRAKAAQEANLAFEVSGKLIARPIDVGDKLQQGQVVAQLDPRDFQNALDRAEAAKTQADALLGRVLEAAEAGAVARQDVTDAEAKAATADATVRIRRKALDDATLVAPFEGTVSAIYVENFQNVVAKQTIVRLLDTSRIEMEVSVPENLIGLAPVAYGIEVEFDAYPGRKIPATIKEIGNEASRATRTYPVTVVMDPPDDMKINPGMAGKLTAKADLPADAQRAGIEIPLSALFSPPDDSEKRSFVWIVDLGGSTVGLREVSIVLMTARGARVNGLEPGERVVTVGVHHLREGQQVSLLD